MEEGYLGDESSGTEASLDGDGKVSRGPSSSWSSSESGRLGGHSFTSLVLRGTEDGHSRCTDEVTGVLSKTEL